VSTSTLLYLEKKGEQVEGKCIGRAIISYIHQERKEGVKDSARKKDRERRMMYIGFCGHL